MRAKKGPTGFRLVFLAGIITFVLLLVGLTVGSCVPDLAAKDIASVQVKVFTRDRQQWMMHELSSAETEELLGIWGTLEGASRLKPLYVGRADVELVANCRSGRHVALRWARAWSNQQAGDYLECTEWGGTFAASGYDGLRSAEMVAYLESWTAKIGSASFSPVPE